MQVYSRYRVKPRAPRPPYHYWVLAVLLGGALVWLWWQASDRAGKGEGPGDTAAITGRVDRPTAAPVDSAGRGPTQAVGRAQPAPVPAATNLTGTNGLPPLPATGFQAEVLQAQMGLVREGISSGSLDGVLGPQTRVALRLFQQINGLPATGALDDATRRQLPSSLVYSHYIVTSNDISRLQPLAVTWLGKSQQSRLDYESVLELVAERAQSHPNLIRRLNPAVRWESVAPGTLLVVPEVRFPPITGRAAFIRIRLLEKTLAAFDERTNLIAHFPCSIARRMEKRPVGRLTVVKVARHPGYRFDPALFPDTWEARNLGRPLLVPSGPNNPVGTAWIGLDRPGYGIHGTPRPEEVGRTESLGCFRLANWNAEYLVQWVWTGLPVFVE